MGAQVLNGFGTSAYQTVIQLCVRFQLLFHSQLLNMSDSRYLTCFLCISGAQCSPAICLGSNLALCKNPKKLTRCCSNKTDWIVVKPRTHHRRKHQ
jgi:hypothetical protein